MAERRRVLLDLSMTEARALLHAAETGTIDDAIDSIGFSAHEKSAYYRAAETLRDAIQAAREPRGRRPKLTEPEWDAIGSAIDFVLAGETDWVDDAVERAMQRVARKLSLERGDHE